MLMTLGAPVSFAVVSVLNKVGLCIFLVTPSQWSPSQHPQLITCNWAEQWFTTASLFLLYISSFLSWELPWRFWFDNSLPCGFQPVKSVLGSLLTEGVLITQARRRGETVSLKKVKWMKALSTSPPLHGCTSFAVNTDPAAAVSIHKRVLAGRMVIEHRFK